MTGGAEQYPFAETDPAAGAASRMPYLPLTVSLGQTNFFLEFDVCFFRSRSIFEVRTRT